MHPIRSRDTTMWILGSFAIYAPSIHIARITYDLVRAQPQSTPFGTVLLATGEEVDWIDTRFGVMALKGVK